MATAAGPACMPLARPAIAGRFGEDLPAAAAPELLPTALRDKRQQAVHAAASGRHAPSHDRTVLRCSTQARAAAALAGSLTQQRPDAAVYAFARVQEVLHCIAGLRSKEFVACSRSRHGARVSADKVQG